VAAAGRVADLVVRVELPELVDLPADFQRVDRRVLAGRRRAVSNSRICKLLDVAFTTSAVRLKLGRHECEEIGE
jgi:hypothetical protein